MIRTDGKRESGKSVLAAPLDDDGYGLNSITSVLIKDGSGIKNKHLIIHTDVTCTNKISEPSFAGFLAFNLT